MRHLRQLSTDVRTALVLAADGRVLAADGVSAAAGTPHARALVEAAAGAALLLRLPGGAGWAVVVSSGPPGPPAGPDRPVTVGAEPTGAEPRAAATDRAAAIVLAAGPHALTDLLLHDSRTLLSDLGARPSSGVQVREAADSSAETVIFAGLGLLAGGNS